MLHIGSVGVLNWHHLEPFHLWWIQKCYIFMEINYSMEPYIGIWWMSVAVFVSLG